jgi:hypothetical protein
MPMPPKSSRRRRTRSASVLTAAAARRWCTTSFTQTGSCLPFPVLWKRAVECPTSAGSSMRLVRAMQSSTVCWSACGEPPDRPHLVDERIVGNVRHCQQFGDEGSRAFPHGAERLGGCLALDLLARALPAPAETLIQTMNIQPELSSGFCWPMPRSVTPSRVTELSLIEITVRSQNSVTRKSACRLA